MIFLVNDMLLQSKHDWALSSLIHVSSILWVLTRRLKGVTGTVPVWAHGPLPPCRPLVLLVDHSSKVRVSKILLLLLTPSNASSYLYGAFAGHSSSLRGYDIIDIVSGVEL